MGKTEIYALRWRGIDWGGTRVKKKRFFKEIYEYKDIEQELEKMAKEGWLLSEIKGNTWGFEACTPMESVFSITLHGDEGVFDYPDGIEKKSLRELCEESGWTYAADNTIYQVFYRSKDVEGVPVYTDDAVTFSIVEKIVRKNQIPLFLLTALFLFNGFRNWSNYNRFAHITSDPSTFFPWSFLAFLAMGVFLGYSEYWLNKNKKNLDLHGPIFFYSKMQIRLRNILVYGLIIGYLIPIFSRLLHLDGHADVVVVMLLIFGVQMVVLKWVLGRFKKVKRSKKKNILIYALTGVAIWIVSVFMIFTYIS
jgi:hypothetical protein